MFCPFWSRLSQGTRSQPARTQRTHPVNVLGFAQTMRWALGPAVAAPGLAHAPRTEGSPPTFRSPNPFAQVKTSRTPRSFSLCGFYQCLLSYQ